ncbi:MAG: hypothetical protein IJV48_08375 [Ruminococcus sp.]|nr:hypothetical protein [Ruminococcus sp.]
MSDIELTAREQEYLDCEVPLVSTGSAAARITMGVFASMLQTVFTPSVDKADRGLMKTIREIRYTRYKKAVLRKLSGESTEKDKKTLKKLNEKPFILEVDTYDADKYAQELYEEYMRTHERDQEYDR